MRILTLVLLLATFVVTSQTVYGEEVTPPVYKVALSCTPKHVPAEKGGPFLLKKGERIELGCFMTNATEDSLTGTLSAKEYRSKGSDTRISSTDIVLASGESQAVDLVFAPLFVTGSYYYAVSLTGANNQALSPTVTLTTLLEGQNQPAIASAHLDKGQYAWSDLAVLTVALTDETTSNMLKDQGVQLSVMMLDEKGTNCTTLLTQERVTSVTGEYRFKFSPEVSCTNTIRVVLQNDKTETLDEKVLAVALPEREKGPTPAGLKNLASASGVVWAIVVIVILTLVYWLWRRKRA